MDMLFVLAAFVVAWAFAAKKLAKHHFLIRHAAGFLAGCIGAIFSVLIGQDLGLIERSTEVKTRGVVTAFLAVSALIIFGAIKLVRWGGKLASSRPEKPAKPQEITPPQKGSWLLSKEQKKKFKHYPGHSKPAMPGANKAASPAGRATRAIRTGWSMGDVLFTYEDSNGNITDRTITVHSVSDPYIKGECHDRRAERTFRLDRIIGDIVDLETGEILPAKKWARNIK